MKRLIGVFYSVVLMVALSCSALAVSDKASYESLLLSGVVESGICVGHCKPTNEESKLTENNSTKAKVLALKENIESLDGAFAISGGSSAAPLSIHPSFVAANDYHCHNWRMQSA